MSYEAWRISYQSSEQAARAAYAKVIELTSENGELKQRLAIERRRHLSSKGRIVCRCRQGYGSDIDGLCCKCRGKTAYEAFHNADTK